MGYMRFADKPGANGEQTTIERLILVLDVSPSMEATDWPPSRLEAARAAASALIRRKAEIAPTDEVGIVSYCREAQVVAPVQSVGAHQHALIDALKTLKVGDATNIHAGLSLAQRQLEGTILPPWLGRLLRDVGNRNGHTGRIVLLTDGQHNSGVWDPRALASTLKKDGVIIDCLGIGGQPHDVDEALLKTVASVDPHTSQPRYAFIADKEQLIVRFEQLAGRIARD